MWQYLYWVYYDHMKSKQFFKQKGTHIKVYVLYWSFFLYEIDNCVDVDENGIQIQYKSIVLVTDSQISFFCYNEAVLFF